MADPSGYEDFGNDQPYLAPLTPIEGVAPAESVLPFRGLEINLGAIAQGTYLDPLDIAIANPVLGETVTIISGCGFTADLAASTASSRPARSCLTPPRWAPTR
jgi:hypothetical protein